MLLFFFFDVAFYGLQSENESLYTKTKARASLSARLLLLIIKYAAITECQVCNQTVKPNTKSLSLNRRSDEPCTEIAEVIHNRRERELAARNDNAYKHHHDNSE